VKEREKRGRVVESQKGRKMKYREKHTNAKREWGKRKRERKGEKRKRRRRRKQTETARNRGVESHHQRSISLMGGWGPAHTRERVHCTCSVCVI